MPAPESYLHSMISCSDSIPFFLLTAEPFLDPCTLLMAPCAMFAMSLRVGTNVCPGRADWASSSSICTSSGMVLNISCAMSSTTSSPLLPALRKGKELRYMGEASLTNTNYLERESTQHISQYVELSKHYI